MGAWLESTGGRGIGAPADAGTAPSSGAVYVFRRSLGWTEEAYVKAPNAEEQDAFGAAVALSGDGNRLVVGAPGEDSIGTGVDSPLAANNDALRSGAAYAYTRAGASWVPSAYLKASNAAAGDEFGTSVAFSRDGTTLAVASVIEASNARGVGAARPTTRLRAAAPCMSFVRGRAGRRKRT